MIQEAIAQVVERQNLTMSQMESVMEEITGGQATPAQIASLITALRMKGETVEEISAAAKIMRQKATHVDAGSPAEILVDTCGTGGDGVQTFNISTATAFVAAGAGLRVAKHGNRSVSSTCGSADVLEALGLNLALTADQVGTCIREVGIGFMFAPTLHGTMKHAIGPRKEIAIRTIFNVLGPLTNPAGARTQLLGVYRRDLTPLLASVLGKLGSTRALVVHGEDGMDEITTTGTTSVSEWNQGQVRDYTLHPDQFDLPTSRLEDLRGGTAEENARIVTQLFEGDKGPRRDIVLFNAGATLYAAGAAETIARGIDLARQALDQGMAKQKLASLVQYSSRFN